MPNLTVPMQSAGQLTELGADDRAGDSTKLAITTLHDVEEDIWAPTWGLKGKLDASLQVLLEEPKTTSGKTLSTLPHIRSYSTPLEIKTGRSVTGLEHRAQTLLYAILMADRYGVSCLRCCLLVYLSDTCCPFYCNLTYGFDAN